MREILLLVFVVGKCGGYYVCVSVCVCMCSVAPQLGVVVSVCDWKTASFHHRLKFDYVTRDWEAWVSRVILNYKRQRRWVEEGHLVWKIHSSLQQYNTSLATVPEKQMLITVFYMHCSREPYIRNLTLESSFILAFVCSLSGPHQFVFVCFCFFWGFFLFLFFFRKVGLTMDLEKNN